MESERSMKRFEFVLSTLAVAAAWVGFVFYFKDTPTVLGRPMLSRLVILGFFPGMIVFVIVLAVSTFVNPKKQLHN